jgi:hypothetical protein
LGAFWNILDIVGVFQEEVDSCVVEIKEGLSREGSGSGGD